MLKYKDLLIELVKRDIKSKYKQSILGYTWVLIVPLINLAVMTVVFSLFSEYLQGTFLTRVSFCRLEPWLFTANAIFLQRQVRSEYNTYQNYPSEVCFADSFVTSKVIDFIWLFDMTLFIGIYQILWFWTLLFFPVNFIPNLNWCWDKFHIIHHQCLFRDVVTL
jgi:ABC-2 type transport system permease protein